MRKQENFKGKFLLLALTEYSMSRKSGATEELLFSKLRKNVRKKLLKCSVSSHNCCEFLTNSQLLQPKALYIMSSRKLRWCCHVNTTAKRDMFSGRVESWHGNTETITLSISALMVEEARASETSSVTSTSQYGAACHKSSLHSPPWESENSPNTFLCVVPEYFNFPIFSNKSLAVLITWFLSVFWPCHTNIYLIFSVRTEKNDVGIEDWAYSLCLLPHQRHYKHIIVFQFLSWHR
jgi:hypothetical protein